MKARRHIGTKARREDTAARSPSSFILHPSSFKKRSAFTLVEVTISVALALVLMLGIAQVFRITGDAVGTGQSLASVLRDAKAAQTVFSRDLGGAVRDGSPFMMLSSHQLFAFRNRADLQGDADGDPSTLNEGTTSEAQLNAFQTSVRSHRTDCLNFFARGTFARQTGAQYNSATAPNSASPFIALMSGSEANIWYGHLKVPNNDGFYHPPSYGDLSPGGGNLTGSTPNANNFFADDWILGRVQMLLALPSTIAPNGASTPSQISDSSGYEQYAYTPGRAATSPLSFDSVATRTAASGNLQLDSSTGSISTGIGTTTAQLITPRVDLAETSIATYFNQLQALIGSPGGTIYNPSWYNGVSGAGTMMCNNQYRYWAFPTITSKPITSQIMAFSTPVLVRSCTQFIVEYAGDYLNQNASTGQVTDTYVHLATASEYPPVLTATPTAGSTDGQIDFYIPANSTTRRIQWYGMPRSPSGSNTISYKNGDVVPLRDLWQTSIGPAPGKCAPFEVDINPSNANALPTTTVNSSINYTNATSPSGGGGYNYTCVWGPLDPKPKMIRITMVVDDPQGRLGDGQTYEYIFTLP